MAEHIISTKELYTWRDFELTFDLSEDLCVHINDGKSKWSGYKFLHQSWGGYEEDHQFKIDCPRHIDYIKIGKDDATGWCEGHFETLNRENVTVETPIIPDMNPIYLEWTDDLDRAKWLTFTVEGNELHILNGQNELWSGYFIHSCSPQPRSCTIDMMDSCIDEADTIIAANIGEDEVWFQLEDGTYLRFPK